jgi:Zn-finger nucleic acid-binding protein
MKCPRDGSALKTTKYEGHVELDVCSACGGSWLDKGELETIQDLRVREHARVRPDSVTLSAQRAAQLETKAIPCPKCGAETDVRDYGYGSQIVIDACPQGCGVWLDGGEAQALERLVEQSQSEAADVVPLRLRSWARLYDLLGR